VCPENPVYYLVLDGPAERPVHVFLARASRFGARAVHLSLLTADESDGRMPAPVRRAIGRSVGNPTWFVEFASADEARRCGFEPVGPYRVCDVWDDYLDPWPVPPA
jgi:hypothetical protein